ncbi:hypothetical protein ACE1CI_35700 [Aerosakkonemataceae cyanobacterium BLCC-F50]|uniref:Type II toxin-antitoxin system RelE/ParE family toxin n=1 Tax=Floridaenema flaviceps BLCC-F50 TaxID=3153642 RepID=A0ABV4Y4B5_9CYAN
MSRCLISPSASRDLNAISDYFLERKLSGDRQFIFTTTIVSADKLNLN